MITIPDLIIAADSTNWFSNLGNFRNQSAMVSLESLQDKDASLSGASQTLNSIIAKMEWLPTTQDVEDPIHEGKLKKIAVEQKKEEECRRIGLDVYKQVLISLRSVPNNTMLSIGPHDLTEAAKGAALYAFKKAAWEIVLTHQSFWCSLVPLYVAGNWPCGLMQDKSLVVF